MMKKIAAALVAASMLTAPLLAASPSEAATATGQAATPAKPGIKAVKKHRKHVRHVRRSNTKYVKVVRHGKVMFVKAKARHHLKQVKKPGKQITRTKIRKPHAA